MAGNASTGRRPVMKIGRDRPTGGVTTDARVSAMTDLERTDTSRLTRTSSADGHPDGPSGRPDVTAVPA